MTIRPATPADAAAVRAIYAPSVTDSATSFETEVPSVEEVRRRIVSVLATHPWLVAEDADGVTGYAYGSPHRARAAYRWAAEVSVYVDGRARRRGVAHALYAELLERLRRQGFALALAGVTLPNPASVGFHEALGFRPVGVFPALGFKHGAWHDVGWWTLRLRDTSPPDDRPAPARRHRLMQMHHDTAEARDTLSAHISRAPMRTVLLVLAVVSLSACSLFDGDPPPPLPAGVTATVDGRPFLFNITMGWAAPGTAAPLWISGARMDTDGMRMIQLTVPARVGTYTAGSAETSAVYLYTTAADTTSQMWMAGEGVPGTSLDIRVTALDADHAEGTFSFTAHHLDEPSRAVTITGGTFSVALQEPPDATPTPRDAIPVAVRAFDGARLSSVR